MQCFIFSHPLSKLSQLKKCKNFEFRKTFKMVDFIPKIDIKSHPEYKTLVYHYNDCGFVLENFAELVEHIHSEHLAQEAQNPGDHAQRVSGSSQT